MTFLLRAKIATFPNRNNEFLKNNTFPAGSTAARPFGQVKHWISSDGMKWQMCRHPVCEEWRSRQQRLRQTRHFNDRSHQGLRSANKLGSKLAANLDFAIFHSCGSFGDADN
jgi:hypothetical protein